jgi:hypothetical protein
MDNKTNNKSVAIWFAVNKNGNVRMFLDNPTKNVQLGIWESKRPYVNSILYKDICQIVQQARMNFENNPEVIEIQIKW